MFENSLPLRNCGMDFMTTETSSGDAPVIIIIIIQNSTGLQLRPKKKK